MYISVLELFWSNAIWLSFLPNLSNFDPVVILHPISCTWKCPSNLEMMSGEAPPKTAGRMHSRQAAHMHVHTCAPPHVICNFTFSSSLYTSQSFSEHVHLIPWQWKQAVYNTSRELEQQFCECCSTFLTINDVVVHIRFTTRVFYLRPNGCNLKLIRLVFVCLFLFGNLVGFVCFFVFFHSF